MKIVAGQGSCFFFAPFVDLLRFLPPYSPIVYDLHHLLFWRCGAKLGPCSDWTFQGWGLVLGR